MTRPFVLLLALMAFCSSAAYADDGGTWAAYSDHRSGAYAIAWGFPTEKAALAAAREECRRRSGEECSVGEDFAGFRLPCVAVMSRRLYDGRTMHRPGYGRTHEEATANAEWMCELVNITYGNYKPPRCSFVQSRCAER